MNATPLALNIVEETVVGSHRMGVPCADVGCQTDAYPPSDTNAEQSGENPVQHERDSRTTDTVCQSCDDEMYSSGKSEECAQLKLSSSAVLAHQRSRSNEIDYMVAAGRPVTASFQSPPGSYSNLRAFRPVSTASTYPGSAFSSDSFSTAMTADSKDYSSRNGISDSCRTLTPSSDKAVQQSNPVKRVSSGGPTVSSSHWSREFATMSDYFTSDSNIEGTDC